MEVVQRVNLTGYYNLHCNDIKHIPSLVLPIPSKGTDKISDSDPLGSKERLLTIKL